MRPMPPRRPNDRLPKWAFGVGCLAILLWALFWGTIIFVAAHFILKYW